MPREACRMSYRIKLPKIFGTAVFVYLQKLGLHSHPLALGTSHLIDTWHSSCKFWIIGENIQLIIIHYTKVMNL